MRQPVMALRLLMEKKATTPSVPFSRMEHGGA
jgi:hypothetical protein